MINEGDLSAEEEIDGLVITHLKGRTDGKDYIVIVNQNYEKDQKIRFLLPNNIFTKLYAYPDPVLTSIPAPGNIMTPPTWYERTIPAGGCIAIEWW